MLFHKDAESGFAPNVHLFMANAAAVSLRLRRPEDLLITEGSASLTAGGGRASADGKQLDLGGGAVRIDSFHTEVTGDFVDRAAAARLTESKGGTVSAWATNQLEVTTTSECTVNGIQAVNFEDETPAETKVLRAGQLDFKMDGRHRRSLEDSLEVRFARLSFGELSINGKALRVSARPELFDGLPTFESFKNEFNNNAAFRKEYGHMVARPSAEGLRWPDDKLYDRRGFAIVTVVNKIEWADQKGCDSGIKINGHAVIVPGFGTIYLGEMTISPVQRRLHMVRIAMGCRYGGEAAMASGCPGGHEFP